MRPRQERCTACLEHRLADGLRRFGGRLVCSDCRVALCRLARCSSFRAFSRPSVLAMFAAEVAVRTMPRLDQTS
jgi:hypothetical protein